MWSRGRWGRALSAWLTLGGSVGELAEDFLRIYPEARCSVVENPTMVALMSSHPRIAFVTEIPPLCDIFFSSSTLQYIEKPYDVLEAGFASAKHAVVLTRNCFCERDGFRVQRTNLFRNGSGPIPPGFKDARVSYPHRTVKESEVHRIAARHDFECIARIDEPIEFGHGHQAYGAQIVFSKRYQQSVSDQNCAAN